jgi:hypothetical protein
MRPTVDPVDDLIERIRHPWVWMLKHPLRAVVRHAGTWLWL